MFRLIVIPCGPTRRPSWILKGGLGVHCMSTKDRLFVPWMPYKQRLTRRTWNHLQGASARHIAFLKSGSKWRIGSIPRYRFFLVQHRPAGDFYNKSEMLVVGKKIRTEARINEKAARVEPCGLRWDAMGLGLRSR